MIIKKPPQLQAAAVFAFSKCAARSVSKHAVLEGGGALDVGLGAIEKLLMANFRASGDLFEGSFWSMQT